MGEDETVIRLCLDRWEDGDAESVAYRDIEAVPKVLIRKREEFAVTDTR